MATTRTFRDAYGLTAEIREDERNAEYPYSLKVYAGNGHCFCNRSYATYRGARAAMSAQGYCWTATGEVTA